MVDRRWMPAAHLIPVHYLRTTFDLLQTAQQTGQQERGLEQQIHSGDSLLIYWQRCLYALPVKVTTTRIRKRTQLLFHPDTG